MRLSDHDIDHKCPKCGSMMYFKMQYINGSPHYFYQCNICGYNDNDTATIAYSTNTIDDNSYIPKFLMNGPNISPFMIRRLRS